MDVAAGEEAARLIPEKGRNELEGGVHLHVTQGLDYVTV